MISQDNDPEFVLVLKPGICVEICGLKMEIEAELKRTYDCTYFRVLTYSEQGVDILNVEQEMILRIGNSEGSLLNELKVRDILKDHPLINQELKSQWLDNVSIELSDEDAMAMTSEPSQDNEDDLDESNYLSEEIVPLATYYTKAIATISEFTIESETLMALGESKLELPKALLIAIQLCQFVRNLIAHGWCMYDVPLAGITFTKTLRFHELNCFAPLNSCLPIILGGQFCPPELSYQNTILTEASSTYIVGKVVLHLVSNSEHPNAIPRMSLLHQTLLLATSHNFEDRPSLDQLLKLIFDTRVQHKHAFHWSHYGKSEIGLSLHRLHNEDSFCILSQTINQNQILLAAVADGMGGMSSGEVASRIAVNTLIEAISNLSTESIETWLTQSIELANYMIADTIDNGGTTLSVVLIVNDKLYFGHIGDSRISVIRRGVCCQVSQDHSKVAMLVANGDIRPEDCLEHPERNVLIRSLGAVRQLPQNYIQTSGNSIGDYPLQMQHGDVITLCSDGAWDYLESRDPQLLAASDQPITQRVQQALEYVLTQEAHDNATLIVLECKDG